MGFFDEANRLEKLSKLGDSLVRLNNRPPQYTAIERGEEESFEPEYDADGSQTRVKTGTGIWDVTYDALNRPVTFPNEDGATVVECAYDYMGRRYMKKVTVDGEVALHHRYIYRGYIYKSRVVT